MNEFELITHYFQRQTIQREDVILPIGDDAAVLQCPIQQQLVSTMDTLVEGVHFDQHMSPEAIGYKLAMVNLSDIAAMGAMPAWASLSLAIPSIDEKWLDGFCRGFFNALKKYNVQLIGGDSVRGSLTLTCHLMGFVAPGEALTRRGACVGDIILVSGYLGDAGLALQRQSEGKDVDPYLLKRLQFPDARVNLGQALKGIANAVIDISDGLLADCQHILQQSGVGAKIEVAQLPLSQAMCEETDFMQAVQLALTSGDDYELCFCVPPNKLSLISDLSKKLKLPLTPIGEVTQQKDLLVFNHDGSQLHFATSGYNHFI